MLVTSPSPFGASRLFPLPHSGGEGILRRILDPRFSEAFGAQAAGVAASAMAAVGKRVVAAVAERGIEPQPPRLERNRGLGHVLKRRMDGERFSLDSGLGREVRQPLEL